MNILPKKRWHVRTRDNMARVRRDEAAARAKAETEAQRVRLAEQEARTTLLRQRARGHNNETKEETNAAKTDSLSHVNFFADLEAGETTSNTNADREAEKKREQEDYEKKIGLLTYLGQDTHELNGDKAWWQSLPINRYEDQKSKTNKCDQVDKETNTNNVEKKLRLEDPLQDMRKYLKCEGIRNVIDQASSETRESREKKKEKDKTKTKTKKKKSKKDKKKKRRRRRHESSSSSSSSSAAMESSSSKKKKLLLLRKQRLEREEREKKRVADLFNKDDNTKNNGKSLGHEQKYHSQFNPQVAKQNKLDSNKKYWLE